MNIVIPMAGEGSRFKQAGYQKPKPFIDVMGKPMIAHIMENLSYPNAQYFLIARQAHLDQEKALVRSIEKSYNAHFIGLEKLTEGTACTVLFAREFINNATPLLIANSDQLVDIRIADYIDDCFNRGLDGSILTFTDKELNPKWSFARIDESAMVLEVQEKKAISPYATVGIYLFSQGSCFVDAAIDMIIHNDRVNNEFYTCPVYNYLLQAKKKIGIYNMEFFQMHGLGTPEDLKNYTTKLLQNQSK